MSLPTGPQQGSLRRPDGTFAPGVSGNPSGRPSLPAEVKAKLRQLRADAVEKLGQLLLSDDERIALAAANSILERSGIVTIKLSDFETDDDAKIQSGIAVESLSSDQLRRILEIMREGAQ